jgi:hypothetical protein
MSLPFSEVSDILLQAGYSPQLTEEALQDLLKKYPKLEAEAFSQAMSTVQPDIEAPDEWVEDLLKELQISYDREILE